MDKRISWSKWFDFVREIVITKEIEGEQLIELLKEEYQYYQKVEDKFGSSIDRRLTKDDFVSSMTDDIRVQRAKSVA